MIDNPKLFFVSGIPASGKTFFGQWLEARQAYLHIDPEEDDRLDRLGVHKVWDESLSSGSCREFAPRLLQLERPVIFNWGFHPKHLYIARALQHAGFSCWWFDAPTDWARRAFIRRGGNKSLAGFDEQHERSGLRGMRLSQCLRPM